MTQEITKVRRHPYAANPPFSGQWIADVVRDPSCATGYIQPDGTGGRAYGYDSKEEAEAAAALYVAKNVAEDLGVETSARSVAKTTCGECGRFRGNSVSCINAPDGYYPREDELVNLCGRFKPKTPAGDDEIRTFDTGATRDTMAGKLSYVKALSPIVLQRYVQYLDAHRKQPDGSMRDFDNWKKGIPEEAYLDGLGRHQMAAWLLAQGYSAEDNHGSVTLVDTLCAIIFGASGWLHKLLEKELKENNHLAG